jgi:transcriptional regulator with PAS, ATPase and Fis domain
MIDWLRESSQRLSEKAVILREIAKTASTLHKKQIESVIHEMEALDARIMEMDDTGNGSGERIDLLLKTFSTMIIGDSVGEILQSALEGASKLVGANYGAIILRTEFEASSPPMICYPPGCKEPYPYSRTIIQDVINSGKSVFVIDILTDKKYSDTMSIQSKRIVSILAVPIYSFGEIIGTVYLDSRDASRDFSEDDLAFLRNFASIVSLALESDIRRARRIAYLEKESSKDFRGLIGKSAVFLKVLELIDRYAPLRQPVLILGESGTGKKLVAQELHRRSNRKDPFVDVNCSNIPETLFESELFGYRKGAFTGAFENREGLIAVAQDGTLFLDEIGDLEPGTQSKILQFLDNASYRILGDSRNVQQSNARVITATNKNLTKLIEQDKFREDLYYRLNNLTIELPPLRERIDDIPELCRHFTDISCKELKKNLIGIEDAVIDRLKRMQWKGNVRELKHFIERLVIHADGPSISCDLLDRMTGKHEKVIDPYLYLEGLKEQDIVDNVRKNAIAKTSGNLKQAAELLDISPSTLSKWLKREAAD